MFVNSMQETLNREFNDSVTENGTQGYRNSGKAILDLNFKVASLRSAKESEIIDLFMKAFYEDKLVAIKWLFFVRDCRLGIGERRLFRVIVKHLCNKNPEGLKNLIQYIPEYGRFDDLWCVLDTQHAGIVIKMVRKQLAEDEVNMKDGFNISLLAKWMPSVNTSSKRTRTRARKIRTMLGMNEERYRKLLSALRKYIDVVEVKMSAKDWNQINYEQVPSRANLIYSNAFLRNDEERRREYLNALEKGEAKINSSVLFPHDIVHKYDANHYGLNPKDPALEAMWNSLPDIVNGNGNTIVVADGSGSMQTGVGGTNITALSVANALAIYFSERSTGQFKDMYITFSERPQLVDFSKCGSLREKIEVALRHSEVANTNIEAVFELILKTAVNKKIKQSDLLQNILIITDLEFDACVVDSASGYGRGITNAKLFDAIAFKY
ncbi:MAG: DUF2828 family protein, partial [Oscillospiraceae bacterium]|nr:DUF2828 family protein [Oscillospiraceae bacterium]